MLIFYKFTLIQASTWDRTPQSQIYVPIFNPNDVFDNVPSGDHFILSANANKICNVSIKMPMGKRTEILKLKSIEPQRCENSPLQCSVTTNSLGRYILSSHDHSKIL